MLISVGRGPLWPMICRPTAMEPLVTMTVCQPSSRSAAASMARRPMKARSRRPSFPTRVEEPIFTTTRFTGRPF